MEQFYPGAIDVFPCWESDRPDVLTGDEIAAERMELLTRLLTDEKETLNLVVPIQSLIFPVPRKESLKEHCRIIRVNDFVKLDEIADWLVEHNFSRIEQIEQPGDFSIRGGIIDIYPSGLGYPVRIELFGDEIESIRRIDPASQRSLEHISEFTLYALPEFFDKQENCMLTEYLG